MTSIESLFEKLWELPKDKLSWHSVLKQAKEMHKDELFEFWQGGINCTEEGGKSFEQYYNENYNKDQQ